MASTTRLPSDARRLSDRLVLVEALVWLADLLVLHPKGGAIGSQGTQVY